MADTITIPIPLEGENGMDYISRCLQLTIDPTLGNIEIWGGLQKRDEGFNPTLRYLNDHCWVKFLKEFSHYFTSDHRVLFDNRTHLANTIRLELEEMNFVFHNTPLQLPPDATLGLEQKQKALDEEKRKYFIRVVNARAKVYKEKMEQLAAARQHQEMVRHAQQQPPVYYDQNLLVHHQHQMHHHQQQYHYPAPYPHMHHHGYPYPPPPPVVYNINQYYGQQHPQHQLQSSNGTAVQNANRDSPDSVLGVGIPNVDDGGLGLNGDVNVDVNSLYKVWEQGN